MQEQVLGNFTYFAKAQVAYAKRNYKKARKYLDKYLVSRNQKHISFKDDMLMGSQFYCLKGKIDESFGDYCIALESYEHSLLLMNKICEQQKNKILASGSDDMYMKAWELVSERGEACTSYLQKKLSIGFNRAIHLIDQLEKTVV